MVEVLNDKPGLFSPQEMEKIKSNAQFFGS